MDGEQQAGRPGDGTARSEAQREETDEQRRRRVQEQIRQVESERGSTPEAVVEGETQARQRPEVAVGEIGLGDEDVVVGQKLGEPFERLNAGIVDDEEPIVPDETAAERVPVNQDGGERYQGEGEGPARSRGRRARWNFMAPPVRSCRAGGVAMRAASGQC